MLSRFVIAFLPRSKHLLISWLLQPFKLAKKFNLLKAEKKDSVILQLRKKNASCSLNFKSFCVILQFTLSIHTSHLIVPAHLRLCQLQKRSFP